MTHEDVPAPSRPAACGDKAQIIADRFSVLILFMPILCLSGQALSRQKNDPGWGRI